MPSVNRDIAKILGRTEAANTDNVALASGSGLTVYATPNLLPTSGLTAGDQAFVTSNNRIYISNGSGWYNVALINSTPTFTSGPAGSYALATDLTPTVISLVAQDSDGQVVTYSATPSGMDGIATLSQDSSVFTVTPLTDSAGGNIGSFTITFQATDGIGIASEVSTFSLSFAPAETIIVASDQTANAVFGTNVSISADGNYAIIGAQQLDASRGAAYIFTRSGSTWTQQAKLTASDAYPVDYFGNSVSINSDGTYVIIGSRYNDLGDPSGTPNIGAAYIFTRTGSTWTEQQKLTHLIAGINYNAQSGDEFGHSVSIDSTGTRVVVGANRQDVSFSNDGSAFVFTRSGSTWSVEWRLSTGERQAEDNFGIQVAISNDGSYVIVGAYGEDGGGGDPINGAGAAYIFTRSGTSWSQQAKLTASDAQATDYFGMGVAISGDTNYAVVGSYIEDGGAGDPLTSAGAAYVFTRSGSTWTEQAKLTASDAQATAYFSDKAVDIDSDGDFIIIGARGSQKAYTFTRSGSTWTQQHILTASDAQAGDQFASSVATNFDGTYHIVGAPYEDGGAGDPLTNAGAAYIYEAG